MKRRGARVIFSIMTIVLLAGCVGATPNSTTGILSSPSAGSTATITAPALKDPRSLASTWAGIAPAGARARLGKGRLGDIAVSPDGKNIAAASAAGIYCLDTDTFSEKWVYPSPSRVNRAAFSPSGDTIAVGFFDGVIHLLSAEDGTKLNEFSGEWDYYFGMGFSPDGALFAFTTKDSIRLWNIKQSSEEIIPAGNDDFPTGLAFSPDGKALAVGYYSGKIIFWDISTKASMRTITGHENSIARMAFSPDGAFLATGDRDGIINMWDASSGDKRWSEDVAEYAYEYDFSFSPDGAVFAMGSSTGSLHFVETATGSFLFEKDDSRSLEIAALTFSPSGETLYASSAFALYAISVDTRDIKNIMYGFSYEIADMVVYPDGKAIAAAADPLILWDMETLAPTAASLENRMFHFADPLAVSPDGAYLAIAGFGGNIKMYDPNNFSSIRDWDAHSDRVVSMKFSPDSRIFATASEDESIILWDTGSWEKVFTFQDKYTYYTHDLAFSPDLRTLAAATPGGLILWDITNGETLGVYELPNGAGFLSAAFSPDGKVVASIFYSGAIALWDIASGESVFNKSIPSCPPNYQWPYGTLLGYLNENRLVVGCGNGNILVIDPQKGEWTDHPGHGGPITSIQIIPDQKTVVSSSADGTVIIWDRLWE
jgi:WD40 repeat protein